MKVQNLKNFNVTLELPIEPKYAMKIACVIIYFEERATVMSHFNLPQLSVEQKIYNYMNNVKIVIIFCSVLLCDR